MNMVKQEGQKEESRTSEKIVLGRITGVYGVKGWLKVFSYTDPMESIVNYSPWYIRPENRKTSPWIRVKLKAGKRHAKTVVAKLEHCNDCDEAQSFIGSEIAIEQEQLEELKEKNQYYWRDLIGLSVINRQNIKLGVVKDLMETGANDVLVVVSEEKAETEGSEVEIRQRLIPWTMNIAIIAVDLEQAVIKVDWDADF